MRWWGWDCEWSSLEPTGAYVRLSLGYVRCLLSLTVSVFAIWLASCCLGGAQPLWGAVCSLPVCNTDGERPPYLPAARSWRSFWWLKWLVGDTWYFSSGEKLGFLFRIYFFHVPWNSIHFAPVEVTNGTQVASDFAYLSLLVQKKDNTKLYVAAKVGQSLTKSCMFMIL